MRLRREAAISFSMILFGVFNLMKICSAASMDADRDESSLLALKARILNSEALVTNWSQGAPFCSWMGVSCSKRHTLRVTALNLSYMGLEGTIPKEIGNLSFLTYLDIRNNSFSGPIPTELGNLRRLRILRMMYNQLSGGIPSTIGNLWKLERLSLYGNQLTGTIPSNIFNISSLELIYLYDNQLSGSLPQDIGQQMPNLQYLDISENLLSGNLPLVSLSSSCPQLKIIWMSSNNNLRGNIPIQIGNLSQLQLLALAKNDLKGFIPTTISNLSNLAQLDIGDNNFQGTIPSEIGQLSNLSFLSLQENKFHGKVPNSVFNLSKLQLLSLVGNGLSGELPPSMPQGLPLLRQLFLGDNQFSGMIPNSFSTFSELTHFNINNNLFSGLIPTNLGNLSQLEYLVLSNNHFANNLSIPEQDFISPLKNCIYLKWIVVGPSPIKGEFPKSLGSSNFSTSLERFLVSTCEINGRIPKEIGNLSNLILLDLSGNKLGGAIPESFGSLVNLQRLELNKNMLQGSVPQSFCGMESLYYLSLWGNMLSGQLPLCLGNLASLREIYLTNNAFNSNIPFRKWFSGCIGKLYLGNNFFYGNISSDIGSLKSLVELDISGNRLSGDIPDSIHQLQSLTILSLSNNKLSGSIPESFSDLRELESFDLSQNNLSGSIPKSFESLKSLHYFNVSFNELSGEIPSEGPFKNFTSESFLDNKDLCGDPRFKVEGCKLIKSRTSSKTRLFRYILLPVASAVVAAIIILIVLRYTCKKSSNTLSQSIIAPGISQQERISYYEILNATNNLDEAYLIGRGGFSSVYKGEFSDTMIAAVKVFNLDVQGALKSFDTECKILRNIRHRNLVKVITSCSNLDFKALVMEYVPNGNLDTWIHSTKCSLNLSQRFAIIIDVATALEYLHHGYSTTIVHCDLKPSNIFLDNDMVAHVGDFGIAKLFVGESSMPQTKTLGTIGYMAPEYGSRGLVSTMVDVYSFGILLMEIFTRRKPTDEMFSGELTMKRWVSDSSSNSLMQVVDSGLVNIDDKIARTKHVDCLTLVIGLALQCTAEMP